MDATRRWRAGAVLALGVVGGTGLAGRPARAQEVVRDRDVTITGPRGRSIERITESVRGPGFAERDITIRRPGGTFQSETILRRGGGPGFRPGPGFGPGPRFYGGPRFGPPVIVNNGVGLGNGLLDLGIGAAAGAGIGYLVGAATRPVPPPVLVQPVVPVVPALGYVIPPPVVEYVAPQRYLPPVVPPQRVVVDPVADAMGRLSSHHNHSRRDGAITLGRLGDPRAVPALSERLKNDNAAEVRVASATALGAIGDPRAALILERATVYDKRQDVRDAAAAALARMPANVDPAAVPVPGPQPQALSGPTATPGGFANDPAATTTAPPEVDPIEQPPPPPVPATSTRRGPS